MTNNMGPHAKNFAQQIQSRAPKNFKYLPTSKDYIAPFFVGLMDGDGSIQVNHWRKKVLQYRFVIKLKFHPDNHSMLCNISTLIGGTVRQDKEFVYWCENHQRRINTFLVLFQQYPPLTKKLRCQLSFLKQNLARKDVAWYFANRDHKYDSIKEQRKVLYSPNTHDGDVSTLAKNFQNLDYFAPWCSGFIEAQSCFTKRETGWPS